MVKEKLTGRAVSTLSKVEFHEIPTPKEEQKKEASINCKDEIKWKVLPDSLRVDFTRTVGFEPEKLFSMVVSYYVLHDLVEENALQEIPEEDIKKEISAHLGYYLQEQQGLLARVSHIIADLSSSFGGAPIVLPPVLPPNSRKE